MHRSMVTVCVVAILYCGILFARQYDDPGVRLGFDMTVGNQEMDIGRDSSDIPIYSESAMAYSLALFSVSYGINSKSSHWEPTLYIGSGSATIDGGRLLGISEAEIKNYSGTAYGVGLKARFAMSGSITRFGFDLRIAQFSGEADFVQDIAPNSPAPQDAVTRNAMFCVVIDFHDPNYRPYFALGILSNENEFEDRASPGNPFTVKTKDLAGGKVGIDLRSLMNSGFDMNLEIGFFSGAQFNIGLSYWFNE